MSRRHRHKSNIVERDDGTFEVSISSFLNEYCPYIKHDNGENNCNQNCKRNKKKNDRHRHTIHIKQIEPDELLDNAFNNYMQEVLNKEDK